MIALKPFPDGCKDCRGACCKEVPYGCTPWEPHELEALSSLLPHEVATFEESYRKMNIPYFESWYQPSMLGQCINLTADGLCSLQARGLHKPTACASMDVADPECLEARAKHCQ